VAAVVCLILADAFPSSKTNTLVLASKLLPLCWIEGVTCEGSALFLCQRQFRFVQVQPNGNVINRLSIKALRATSQSMIRAIYSFKIDPLTIISWAKGAKNGAYYCCGQRKRRRG
jgi:hypothetical protein